MTSRRRRRYSRKSWNDTRQWYQAIEADISDLESLGKTFYDTAKYLRGEFNDAIDSGEEMTPRKLNSLGISMINRERTFERMHEYWVDTRKEIERMVRRMSP